MARLSYNLPDLRIRYISDFKLPGEEDKKELNTYSLKRLQAFMYYVLNREKLLTIQEYLELMGHLSYFLLASTGLGKTIAAPIHSYLLHCIEILKNVKSERALFKEQVPRLWVIEPKITIAKDQTDFMNEMFSEFIKSRNDPRDAEHPVLFGCTTSVDKIHRFAPIMFVSTGIFALYARFGYLDPKRDCVMIDEAHVSVESGEGVELAIAICRQMGITIHYMSATVDTGNLRDSLGVHSIIDATKIERKPKWMHNVNRSMEECIVEMVEKTLVHPDPSSDYFPHGDDERSVAIRESVLQEGRAKGFLLVVNSFAEEDSDANTIAELLRNAPYASEIEILFLSSAIFRNKHSREKFKRDLERMDREKKKYAIIATSVVEMGITFPTLDFIATMNSGYDQITIGETEMSEVVPLPVNSLLQRIGRVGRKQPGIGYITNEEVDAYYSSLTDEALNGGGLRYETIRFPFARGSLVLLAQYSFRQEWENPIGELVKLNLPSKIHEDYDKVFEFMKQRQRLLDLGIAVDNQLTTEGKYCERWLDAGVDLGYAINIQEALAQGNKDDLLFYLVAAALSNITLATLRSKDEEPSLDDFPPKFDGRTGARRNRKGVTLNRINVEFTPQSELIALYNIVAYFSNKYAKVLLSGKVMPGFVRSSYQDALNNDCVSCGFDPKKIELLLKGFSDVLRVFCDTNWNRQDFKELFGQVRKLNLTDFIFTTLTEWDIQRFLTEVSDLPGRTHITLTATERGFSWREIDGKREGILYADSTCLDLQNEQVLSAKLVPLPGRGERKAGEAWKLIHAQLESYAEISSPPEQSKDEEEKQDDYDYGSEDYSE